MLNKNTLKRLELVDMAMHGIVRVTMRRQNGTAYTFEATLLPTSQECAKMNTEEYYREQGTTRARVSRERAKKRKILDEHMSWIDKVDRSINLFYLVDAETFRWRQVSLRALLDFKFLGHSR